MQFNKIIGQTDVKDLLKNMVSNDRIPHALLFLGPKGCGKLGLAMALAQYTLCENRTEEDACGECSTCRKNQGLIHPDVHYSYPTVGRDVISTHFLKEWRNFVEKNPYVDINHWLQLISGDPNSNKQGNINRKECLNILQKLSLRSFEGNYKILILWLPEYLKKEGNRLLKLIEEPPEKTLFILVAENQDLILNTILSRCQTVKINSLSDEEIVAGLNDLHLEKTEDQIQTLAFLANGDFNEALALSEKSENNHASLFLDWLRKCYIGNGVDLVKWVNNFASLGRENQKHFIQYGLHFMREYMLLRMTGNTHLRLATQELKTAQNLSKVIDFDQIEAITNLFNDCFYYIERNANPKVLFLDVSIKINKILKIGVVNV